ncbi:DMT family transporter [Streptomyces sp. RB6PN25]|uniref:DMT family transporter n=1 Tax=Streptomyces humicola TaxID=2953240 RepID=A0ABT1PN47_9ACTN|nr:DMT family transporter [Streptomyces humicola]MCQ4079093.1 DMT family transporter [Streptomyces humicola]
MEGALSIVFALLAAASNALATVLQRRAARTVPVSEHLRLGLAVTLLHRRVWLGGMAGVIGAAVFQAVALSLGALSVVQPIFVLELPFALLIGGVVLGRRLSHRCWAGVVCIVVGLGGGLAAAAPSPGTGHPRLGPWVLVLICCCAAIVALVAVALRRPAGAVRASGFGAASAIGYALTAALIKEATYAWQVGGISGFFLAWQTYAFAVVGVSALFLLENAVQSGPITASQPALTLGDALVSLSLGVTLYGEHVRGGWWLLPEVLGAAVVLCGAVLLTSQPLAQSVVAHPRQRQPAARTAADS